jgi:hypothetical protein
MEAYERLASELESAGIKKSNMFGMSVLKLGKKPICGWWDDGVNFKLEPGSEIYRYALSLQGSHMFQPTMKDGRVMKMKNWIIVPFDHEEHYMKLATASIEMVEKELAGS